MKNGKIETFTDLNVWREGHKLVIIIYRITKTFPREEVYSLVDQMRRAAASITDKYRGRIWKTWIQREGTVLLSFKKLFVRTKKFCINS